MKIYCHHVGLQPYESVLDAMRSFVAHRGPETPDECWFLEHPSVFTLGQAGKQEHILDPHDIPVVQTCRGGQVTYHGPGQLIVYTLIDLNRHHLGVKQWVSQLEQAIIQLLASYGVEGQTRCKAPGVYVGEAKIASLGLRVRKGYCYHGLSLNVRMDLEPFQHINPCGYQGLQMAQLSDFVPEVTRIEVQTRLEDILRETLKSPQPPFSKGGHNTPENSMEKGS